MVAKSASEGARAARECAGALLAVAVELERAGVSAGHAPSAADLELAEAAIRVIVQRHFSALAGLPNTHL
jgi:hypothetical protein